MATYWLLGENRNEDLENIGVREDSEENEDEGIDDIDEKLMRPATFTFLISDHDNDSHMNC